MIQNIRAFDVNGNYLDALVQWDRDVYVYVEDEAITAGYPAHWCHNGDTEALVTTSTYTDGKLKIKCPNILLQEPKAIYLYIYVPIDGGNRSIYRIRFNVIERPKPGDIIYIDTPDYVSVATLEQELQNAIGQIDGVVDDVNRIKNEAISAINTAGIGWVNFPSFVTKANSANRLKSFKQTLEGFEMLYPTQPGANFGLIMGCDPVELRRISRVEFDYESDEIGVRSGIYSTANGSTVITLITDKVEATELTGHVAFTINHTLMEQELAAGRSLIWIIWNHYTKKEGERYIRISGVKTNNELPLKALLPTKMDTVSAFEDITVKKSPIRTLDAAYHFGEAAAFVRNVDGTVTITGRAGKSRGLRTDNAFTPYSNVVKIVINTSSVSGGAFLVMLYGKNADSGDADSRELGRIISPGVFEADIDVQYYTVYEKLVAPYYFVVYQPGLDANVSVATATITSLAVYDGEYPWEDGTRLADVLVDEHKLIATNSSDIDELKQPKRFINVIDNNGVVQSIGVIDGQVLQIGWKAENVLFIGNSILNGMEEHGNAQFGMAASNIDSDYCAHVMRHIHSRYPDARYSRVHSNRFESGTANNLALFYEELDAVLDATVDNVILQIGDNINSTERVERFTTNFPNLIAHIRERTNAPIYCISAWFETVAGTISLIQNLCAENDVVFIGIHDLVSVNTCAKIGNIVTYPDGSTYTISDKGTANHPGDEGMRLIADRIIETIFSGADDGYDPKKAIENLTIGVSDDGYGNVTITLGSIN